MKTAYIYENFSIFGLVHVGWQEKALVKTRIATFLVTGSKFENKSGKTRNSLNPKPQSIFGTKEHHFIPVTHNVPNLIGMISKIRPKTGVSGDFCSLFALA